MEPLSSGPVLTVSLRQLGDNLETLRRWRPGVEMAPVVKADAYGLGAQAVASHLHTECSVQSFFVAYAHEAEAVLAALPAGADATVYVLNGFLPADAALYDDMRLVPVLNTAQQVKDWAGRGRCALSIDIGMNRLGLTASELVAHAGELAAITTLIIMHLSHAGSPSAQQNAEQEALYKAHLAQLRPLYPQASFSLDASGGLAIDLQAEEDVARPGILLYGGATDGDPAHALGAVATLTAPVLAVRDVPAGATAGYGGHWTAQRPSRLAVLSIGYADGVRRALWPGGEVLLQGQRCPIAGAVSMDLTTVDVTDLTIPCAPGDVAELFGPNMLIDAHAKPAGTIAYEVLTGVGARVKRLYTD